jgi:replication factor A1
VIRVTNTITNAHHDRVIIILLEFDVVCQCAFKIGNPVSTDGAAPKGGAGAGGDDHAGALAPPAMSLAPPLVSAAPPAPMQATSSVDAWQTRPSAGMGVGAAPPLGGGMGGSRPTGGFGMGPASGGFGGPVAGGMGGGDSLGVFPIASLNPYQPRWRIRARVSLKGPMKTFQNARGEGRLFSVNLIDESGEIKATGAPEIGSMMYVRAFSLGLRA